MLTTDVCRSVDAAAGQLIAREAGAFVDFLKHGGIEAPLDLDARYRMVAARSPEHLETLVRALAAGRPWRTSRGVRPLAVGDGERLDCVCSASSSANCAALRTP